jgi:hypothetical protein
MQYLRRVEIEAGKSKSHIWTGDDTACRMWSTGGLNRTRRWVVEDKALRPICTMCLVNNSKGAVPWT